jgi:hypothetical protein
MARAASQSVVTVESASLDALMADYPQAWQQLGPRLVEAAKGGPTALAALVQALERQAAPWRAKAERSHHNPQVLAAALPALAAARMARLAVERLAQSAATGVETGPVRLGLWSGLLAQRLFFERGLTRKAVSAAAFRRTWPLMPDRRKLLPLLQHKGIYCFYSRELVQGLAALIAGRPCLEVAAGDGTLSRLLAAEGVAVRATDDFSWARVLDYPATVEKLDAASALAAHPSPVVLCSFPPPGNRFERQVFAAREVALYVVVTTRHRFAAGDWKAYASAPGWSGRLDEGLSRLVLPPEVDPAVLVFERA